MAETPPPERTVVQAPRFGKSKRWLPAAVQLEVDAAVHAILADPFVGEPKSGALRGVRVLKIKTGTQQLLIAYTFVAKAQRIEMLDVGPHENFYRELQKYLDAR